MGLRKCKEIMMSFFISRNFTHFFKSTCIAYDVEIKISLVQVEDLEKKVANVIETDKQMSEVSSLTLYHLIFRSLYI